MFIKIQKQHKANKGKTITVCNYGYFLKRGKWEMIAINLFGKTIFIYRKKRYRLEWPVNCG